MAIARNESAYLPEWLFHHLYFGFDSIEVYINQTQDNTPSLVSKVEQIGDDFGLSKVQFIDANSVFESKKQNPQVVVYKQALQKAVKDKISHVLFIDIDEFWTPRDFKTSIKAFIDDFVDADVTVFEWLNKLESQRHFSEAFCEEIQIQRAPQIKALLKVSSFNSKKAPRMSPHNVISSKHNYLMANNKEFKPINDAYSRVHADELNKPVKAAFILHRKFRSQFEYIAGLARLNPVQVETDELPIKSNRGEGYAFRIKPETLRFEKEQLFGYIKQREAFFACFEDELADAHKFVENQYSQVLKKLATISPAAHKLVNNTLRNIDIPEILEIKKRFCG